MDSAQQAILGIATMAPVAVGLYLFGRWRQGDLRLPRDGLVVVGTVLAAVVLGAAFAGPRPATLIVPPVGLLGAGTLIWLTDPRTRSTRIAALLAMTLGVLGLLAAALRLTFE